MEVEADSASYVPGARITRTVTGSIDPNYEETPNIDVRLKFSNSTFDLSAADQALNPPPMFGPQTGFDPAGAGPGVTVYIVLESAAAGPMGLGLALAGRRRSAGR